MEREQDHDEYQQLLFAGLEYEKQEEVTLENTVVQSLPIWEKHGKSYEWGCSVYFPPDIFNQDRSDHYEVHTTAYALEAKKKRLRPGDVVTLKGSSYTQDIDLTGGEQKTIKHLNVTDIEVIKWAKRMSVTVFEQKRSQ